MHVKDIVVNGFLELCKERKIKIKEFATLKRVTPTITTIKKFCDGPGIASGEFFSIPESDRLEQGIC